MDGGAAQCPPPTQPDLRGRTAAAGTARTGGLPSTRYQGSKLKIADWIWSEISKVGFETAVDAMGGTGTVAYKLKQQGKQVGYNDKMRFNFHIGRAIIENPGTRLAAADVEFLGRRHPGVEYGDFVEKTFGGVFYTDEENRWIDTFIGNLRTFQDGYKVSLALASVFQACIIKRPYNLFHRKNLYARFADVKRSFGNKITWDKSFGHWFGHFAGHYNRHVFYNGSDNRATNEDVLDIAEGYDVVYLDPPYTTARNTVDYMEYYHFLEGLCIYLEDGCEAWGRRIDRRRKPLPIMHPKSGWNDRPKLRGMFEGVFKKFSGSAMAVSWSGDGHPSAGDMRELLERHYDRVEVKSVGYKYALSPRRAQELLFVAR